MKLWASLILLFVLTPAFSQAAIPVIIDSDMAADDWLAILYLSQQEGIEIKALTVTGSGEASCEKGVQNALKLLHLAKKDNIPVTCGRPERLEGGNLYPPNWRVQMDALLGFDLPTSVRAEERLDAVTLIHKVLQENTNTTLITLGPVTNIADLLSIYPKDKQKFTMLAMAGVFYAPGNVWDSTRNIKNEVAEWNAFADALALKQVIKSGVNITLIGLDATRHAPLTKEFFTRFKSSHLNTVGEFVYKVLAHDKDFARLEGWYFWDPVTTFALINPKAFEFETVKIEVTTNPLQKRGMTSIVKHGGNKVRVAKKLNGKQFEQNFIDAFQRKGE